jgi:hypothetical protein
MLHIPNVNARPSWGREKREFPSQQRQEVDLIEDSAIGLDAYEVKWNPAKAMSKTFLSAYPQVR